MHITVPGAIGHFYHLQLTLVRVGTGRRANLSKGFHRYVFHWRPLFWDALNRQTFLEKVFQHLTNSLKFCDASGLGAGSVWIDPNGDESRFVWRLAWPRYIVEDLVRSSNPAGRITKYYLELAMLVLQEYCFPNVCSYHKWPASATRSNNTPTVN